MKKNNKLNIFVSLIIALVLLLASCGGTNTSELSDTDKEGSIGTADSDNHNGDGDDGIETDVQNSGNEDVFTMPVSYIPSSLIPHRVDQDEEKSMKQPIYDVLAHLTSEGYEPRLASSIDISEDGLNYTVKIEDSAVWSDGVPITVDDVLFAIEYDALEGQGSSAYTQIDGEEVELTRVDDRTLEFSLPKPSAYYLVRLTTLRPMPAHAFNNEAARVKESEYFSTVGMATSGPYEVVEINTDSVVYKARDDYYGGKAGVGTYILRVMSDGTNRNIALDNGEISYVRIQNNEDLEKYQNDERFKIVSVPEDRVNTLDFNMYGPNSRNFTDEQRRAIAMALDKDEIIALAYGGPELAEPATQLIGPGLTGHNPDLQDIEYNPEEAQRIAEETGLTDISLKFIYNRDRAHMEDQAVAIQSQLARVGIRVEVEGLDSSTFFTLYNRPVMEDKAPINEWDIATNGWNSQRGVGGGLSQFFVTSPMEDGYSQETKELVNVANEAPNQEDAQELWDEFQENAKEEAWIIPITYTNFVMATPVSVMGLENTLVPEFTDFASIYID